jgi:hypothetical protein
MLLICKSLKKNQTKKGKPGMGLWFGSLSPPLVPHSQSHKKKGDQKGKAWHEIVVMVIVMFHQYPPILVPIFLTSTFEKIN